jgi:hypothetical protein
MNPKGDLFNTYIDMSRAAKIAKITPRHQIQALGFNLIGNLIVFRNSGLRLGPAANH